MHKICVFAGTTEGRRLVEFLLAGPVEVTACVATEYGEALLNPAPNLHISAGRLNLEEMKELLIREKFELAVDATHPYATAVTENLVQACREVGMEYLRLLREESAGDAGIMENAVFVPDIAGAVEFLNKTEGNILLTTGSKELAAYTGLTGFSERIYARVLPMEASLQLCQAAGVLPGHILALQGPFSVEMNAAMLRAVSARYMVTKDTGHAGGFEEKAAAAKQAGAGLVVIGRPPQQEGLCFSRVMELLEERFGIPRRPQVAVVGIGPGSRAAMTREAAEAIAQADCLIGAKRMLEAVAEGRQVLVEEIAPEKIAASIRNHGECMRFAVVMSGDVGFYSGTRKLLPLLEGCEVKLFPGLSSLVTLCSRLQTSYEDVKPVSLHGRTADIVQEVRQNKRLFVLVGGEDGMKNLCRTLTDAGLGTVRISVGERLSYPDEKITVGRADELTEKSFSSLSAALVENMSAGEDIAHGLPGEGSRRAIVTHGLPGEGFRRAIVTHGLPDEIFQRGSGADGVVPMTKSEVRSVCLSKLQLTEDAVCWDVGAGTGSVAIEMALQARMGQVYAIERKEAAVELLYENCRKLSVENVSVIPGTAPEICRELPAPTHAFIGGSSGNMKEILSLLLRKNPKVRIAATAISLESVGELTECMRSLPFSQTEVVSLSIAKDKKAGNYHLMTGQNPIYIFTMQG